MTHIELSPCPFCGCEAKIYQETYDSVSWWGVECIDENDCGAIKNGMASEAAAIALWNKRHIPPQIFLDFYNRVCDRAERNMALTGTVSGAHWNAMRQELRALGIEVTR